MARSLEAQHRQVLQVSEEWFTRYLSSKQSHNVHPIEQSFLRIAGNMVFRGVDDEENPVSRVVTKFHLHWHCVEYRFK